ncbi:glycosyltransferase family 4 protein [Persicitalea sp.]|uniref:glycosyltransferase family 4 protein n=1 Tax=Persicitalea sp. TaxID=3100273 RepID=UPI003592FF59
MNILLAIPSLAIGGAEVFVVRLANALSQRGHKVFLLRLRSIRPSSSIEERVFKQVKVVALKDQLSPLQSVWWKLLYVTTQWNPGLHRRVIFLRKKVSAKVLVNFLEKFCLEENIDVINSHLQAADWAVAQYFLKKPRSQRFVISMHGCYNQAKYLVGTAGTAQISSTDRVMEAANRIVLLTPKNKRPLQTFVLKSTPVYIPLGFEKPSASKSVSLCYSSSFPITFGLVSRAVARKGWEEAILAAGLLHDEDIDCRLILVGDGECLPSLINMYDHLSYIEFVGATARVLDWVQKFDVGLFPSYIESESYPNTVIEYLACGKPVIGTDIGEVKNMMSDPDGRLAGKLLHYSPAGTSVEELANCMRQYAENSDLLAAHGSVADAAFEKFDMNRCLDAYEAVYR